MVKGWDVQVNQQTKVLQKYLTTTIYQNGLISPSFSYGDISPLSVKSSMDIDRKKFTLSIELDKHIQYNLNHEI